MVGWVDGGRLLPKSCCQTGVASGSIPSDPKNWLFEHIKRSLDFYFYLIFFFFLIQNTDTTKRDMQKKTGCICSMFSASMHLFFFCMFILVVASVFVQEKYSFIFFFFFLFSYLFFRFELFQGAVIFVRSSPVKSRKRLSRDAFDTLATHTGLVFDVTATDC